MPAGVAAEAHAYLAQGGPANLRELHHFLSDTVLLTGHGFAPPGRAPTWGSLDRAATRHRTARPSRCSTTAPTTWPGTPPSSRRCATRSRTPGGAPAAALLRLAAHAEPELLRHAAARPTRWSSPCSRPAAPSRPAPSAGGDDEAWDVGALAALDVPILQGLCLTSSRADWEANDDGLSPLDVATQVAVPEFDGRLITVPFSFKEIDADGLTAYVPDPERAARVAGIAVRHARLRHIPPPDKRIALMLSAYPTKHARIGNAVGLDTPASAVAAAARRCATPATTSGRGRSRLARASPPQDGDALIHALIAAGGQDPDWLTEEQLAGNPIRISGRHATARWFATLPADLREGVEQHWGPAPGELYVDRRTTRTARSCSPRCAPATSC